MPKIKLEYELPDERDDFRLAINGHDFYFVIIEFDNYLREQLKYHSEELSDGQFQLLEEIRDKFNEIIRDGTNISDIHSFVV